MNRFYRFFGFLFGGTGTPGAQQSHTMYPVLRWWAADGLAYLTDFVQGLILEVLGLTLAFSFVLMVGVFGSYLIPAVAFWLLPIVAVIAALILMVLIAELYVVPIGAAYARDLRTLQVAGGDSSELHGSLMRARTAITGAIAWEIIWFLTVWGAELYLDPLLFIPFLLLPIAVWLFIVHANIAPSQRFYRMAVFLLALIIIGIAAYGFYGVWDRHKEAKKQAAIAAANEAKAKAEAAKTEAGEDESEGEGVDGEAAKPKKPELTPAQLADQARKSTRERKKIALLNLTPWPVHGILVYQPCHGKTENEELLIPRSGYEGVFEQVVPCDAPVHVTVFRAHKNSAGVWEDDKSKRWVYFFHLKDFRFEQDGEPHNEGHLELSPEGALRFAILDDRLDSTGEPLAQDRVGTARVNKPSFLDPTTGRWRN